MLSLGKALDCKQINFVALFYLFKGYVFVSLVDSALFARFFGTESRAVFKRPCIRSAAYRNGLCGFAGYLVVNVAQRFNQKAVFVVVKGGLLVENFVFKSLRFYVFGYFFCGECNGIADVEHHLDKVFAAAD